MRRIDNRTFWALVLGCVFALSVLGLRTLVQDETGVVPNRFWSQKRLWQGCADIVVAGDSRIYRGISPESMKQVLGDQRVLNFAFSGIGLSSPYIAAIEKVLDPKAEQPVVVLGISPHSLTKGAAKDNDFLWRKKTPPTPVPAFLSRFLHLFRPIPDREAFNLTATLLGKGHRTDRYHQEYFANGWIASFRMPEDRKKGLKSYATIFDETRDGPVSQEVIEEFLSETRRLTSDGVTVFGFRPPSCPEMVVLENEKGGFDEKAVARAFENAGGIWLDMDQDAYHSYDGSHLHRESAEALSRALAEQIRLALQE